MLQHTSLKAVLPNRTVYSDGDILYRYCPNSSISNVADVTEKLNFLILIDLNLNLNSTCG